MHKRLRVHVRDANGNRDRLVPLPTHTPEVLREFWKEHHNSVLLFPSRPKGLAGAASAMTHMDRGGVQRALHHESAQGTGAPVSLHRVTGNLPMSVWR